MENTLKLSGCGIHATLLALSMLGGCNSDELRLESASDSQGVTTDSATGPTTGSASMTATETGPTTGGTMSGTMSDSEAGSGSVGESHSTGMSASTTVTATDVTAASATDSTSTTDGTSATDSETLGTVSDTEVTVSDTDVTLTGTTDTGDTDTGEVCSPDVPDDNACEQCMAANCCEQYAACVADNACSCLVDACSAPNAVPVVCALPCALNPQKLMMALAYLMGCSGPCGAQSAALGLL
jgi:hypothetical protein